MKGSPKVLDVLQRAVTACVSMHLQYHLDACDCKRYGLAICDGICKLAEQHESWCSEMVRRIQFLEGAPVLDPESAKPHKDVEDFIDDSLKMETDLADLYAEATRVCWEAGDMSNFHWFQHMSKWILEGDDKYTGHIAWLQKQKWQLDQVGLQSFLAVQLCK